MCVAATAFEQLKSNTRTRQYKDCSSLLSAVLELMAHFKTYRSITQIATLSRNVAELKAQLLEQVCEDFEIAFTRGEVAARKNMLAEACQVIDALGDTAQQRIVNWYCNTQLREYRQVFKGEEAGSLDNISRRYSWFKRVLKVYEEEHAAIFPASWKVNEVLANSYCDGTKDDYKGILSRAMRKEGGKPLDVNLLLSALQETLEFEQFLEKRFEVGARASIDTASSRDERPHVFNKAISAAFEPYLSLWVDAQDQYVGSMLWLDILLTVWQSTLTNDTQIPQSTFAAARRRRRLQPGLISASFQHRAFPLLPPDFCTLRQTIHRL